MIVILNDGVQLEAYSYDASEEYLKIRFINGDREGLKNIFSSEIATKRIQIEGKTFTDHRLDYVTEYTGSIPSHSANQQTVSPALSVFTTGCARI